MGAEDMMTDSDELEITPRLESLIWKRLGVKNARQIAEETGLKPEQVLAIKRNLLESVDVLTIQEKRQKLVVDLQDIAQRAQDDYDSAPFEFKAGILNSAVSAIKAILVELNRADKGEQQAIDRLNDMRIRELIRLIELSVVKTFAVLAERHEMDEDEMFDIFHSYLKPAAREIEG